MKKTIVKSAFITFAVAVAALFLTLIVLTFAMPKTMGGFYESLGFNGVALSCKQKTYENSGDFNDLASLIDYADFIDNDRVLAYYGFDFLDNENFGKYCEEKGGSGIKSQDYYPYIVFRAGQKYGKTDKVGEFSVKLTSSYTKTSPLYSAISLALTGNDTALAKAVVDEYDKNGSEIIDELGSLNDDIDTLRLISGGANNITEG